jgi:uncharacterized protein
MKIDLFSSMPGGDRIEFGCDAGELDISVDEFTVVGPVTVVCDLHRTGELVHVEGRVRTVLEMECSRCVEPFHQAAEEHFSFVVRKLKLGEVIPELPGDGEELNEDNLIFLDHDAHFIDITEFVRDALILSVPLKPLCSERCKGLCPLCGHNLNEGGCECEKKRVDPRWQSLSGLFNVNSEHEKQN